MPQLVSIGGNGILIGMLSTDECSSLMREVDEDGVGTWRDLVDGWMMLWVDGWMDGWMVLWMEEGGKGTPDVRKIGR